MKTFKRYNDVTDDKNAQSEFVDAFQKKIYLRYEDEENQNQYPNLRRYVFSNSLFLVQFNEQADADIAWSVFSMLFVFAYIWWHVGSLFIAVVSINMIVLSFPLTQTIYTLICQISINVDLNQLTVFIIMGIAADNIFVFCDAWKQSGT